MSREPKGPPFEPSDGSEPELGPEEQAELSAALKAAWSPSELSPERQRVLLQRALGSSSGQTSDEQAQSAALRDALEQDLPHPAADLARSLRAAAAPGELDPERARAILERALAPSPSAERKPKPGRLVLVVFGTVSAGLALAAAVALLVRAAPPAEGLRASSSTLALSRSTAPLFAEKFNADESSERIERIAVVRERELRSNRFARWGVR